MTKYLKKNQLIKEIIDFKKYYDHCLMVEKMFIERDEQDGLLEAKKDTSKNFNCYWDYQEQYKKQFGKYYQVEK